MNGGNNGGNNGDNNGDSNGDSNGDRHRSWTLSFPNGQNKFIEGH